MKTLNDAAIEDWKTRHIPYRLRMLDSLRWWCELRMSGKDHNAIKLTVNDERVCALLLTNGVAESGLMACRFLLYFLGLNAKIDDTSPSGYDLNVVQRKQDPGDDIWAERIGCKSASLDDFTLDERHACGYAHKLASQGVGHPTEGSEDAKLTWLIVATEATERAIAEKVYGGDKSVFRSPLRSIKPL